MSSSIQKKTRGKTKRKKKEHTRTGRHRNHYKNKKSLCTDYAKENARKSKSRKNREIADSREPLCFEDKTQKFTMP